MTVYHGSYWDIEKVYKRLILGIASEKHIDIIDALFAGYNPNTMPMIPENITEIHTTFMSMVKFMEPCITFPATCNATQDTPCDFLFLSNITISFVKVYLFLYSIYKFSCIIFVFLCILLVFF